MSMTSKITLGASVVFLFGTVIYDIYDKEIQKANLRKGAVKDKTRQEMKKSQNLQDLVKQNILEEKYKKAIAEKDVGKT